METIEGIVLSVSQKIDGLQGLAKRYSAESQLSDQAVAILKDIDGSTAGTGILFERRQE